MKKKPEGKKRYGRLTVVLSLLILVVSTLNVPCYIAQYEKNYEARQLSAQLDDEINRGKRLMIEYKSRINYKFVEEYATENLNMKKVENYQIEYITKKADEQSVVVKKDGDDGLISRIVSTFSVIAEYFR